MAERIDDKQAEHWSDIASKLRQISELIGQCQLTMLLKLHITEGKALQAIDNIAEAANGQAYMFTPQTEWTGGDSSNPKNFKPTLPHIARN
jgi:hypothetical protein